MSNALIESPATISPALEVLQERLAPLYAKLAAHPLYRSFHSVADVRMFMATHVFAVWDFMSLLKTLQRGLTSVEVPWVPTADASSRRLVNEIVLGEESDAYEGRPVSHFELYLEAMRACGAPTVTIEAVITFLNNGLSVPKALAQAGASRAAQAFVAETFRVIAGGRLHEIAAAFTFGREDLIPDIFRGFIRDQDDRLSGQLTLFRWYLDRHIEVDGDEHGPMALQMVANLCGDDELKWLEAGDAAVEAVEARLALWDAIAAELQST
ncbi:DUF3050 domain-containing protein [Granulicella tundricola]|uniref:Heme oxygenase-like protein n=1 Tax=Granulicella tundricola (strain ATCC BAA-1859 / DSM 23138 / MP5ACTX9) TaxID=1198114 RepID=E8WZA5_GRATM|nr:DUF3050 domain-containing protein [Granulicella tundricola]ADW67707.1 hypothetical protein AciX9_0636 [Granulicella tundricola MP5ACTX9]